MTPYVLTPLAEADIFNIWSYIAAESPDAANLVEGAIFEACELLAQRPLIGHLRRDFTRSPVRFWTVSRYPNYSLVYRPGTQPLEIIAILHGKRDIRRLLKSRP